ncbi:MAG: hypothetical protein M3Y82_12245 [Verrucomicrobiota bacterium]|nr:hypothetical protein [Verrucomicrobiota bacterium]
MNHSSAKFLVLLVFVFIISLQAEEFFPVMAWNAAPNDPAILEKMRECGLTVAGFASTNTLDACHAAGLKAIVSDPRAGGYDWANVDEKIARTNLTSLVADVGKHPAVYGYYLRDEPTSSFFPGLAKVSSILHELAPDKWAYINLFPNYANASQLGAASYTDYLEKFIATCQPTVLSYDHYALMDDGSLKNGYWLNLEQMRAAAQKHHLPFWNIVLAVATFNFREPTAADFRFQVYSTLAYGGRGIAYFTYFAPQVGNYRGAAIDQFGNPTPAWSYMQNVNLQIQKLAPTLLKLSCNDVYHFGSVPEGSHKPTEKSLLKTVDGGDYIAGEFTHEDGSRYALIVNKDVVKSHPCSPKFRIPVKSLKLISPYSGEAIDFSGEQVWIAPGSGALLKLK